MCRPVQMLAYQAALVAGLPYRHDPTPQGLCDATPIRGNEAGIVGRGFLAVVRIGFVTGFPDYVCLLQCCRGALSCHQRFRVFLWYPGAGASLHLLRCARWEWLGGDRAGDVVSC